MHRYGGLQAQPRRMKSLGQHGRFEQQPANPVLAGPVEATAIGNVLVQARAHGVLSGSLEGLRALVARTHPIVTHEPQPDYGATR